MTRLQRLLILGASARAAVSSALRAGLAPCAIDRFGDVDLRASCLSRRADDYPADLARIAREMPECPWMYTGALENQPDLVDAVSSTRPLFGNSASVLRAVRNPFLVAESLRGDGLPHLEVRTSPPAARGRRWLRKPYHSGGGARIRLAVAGDGGDAGAYYYQRLADGTAASAVYVADGKRALLLGMTTQLVGQAWAGAVDFQYCGSVGPLRLGAEADGLVRRIGHCLAACFRLQGLFGVDLVVADDLVWLVEVNPRYTASVEVIERSLDIAAIALHVAVCRGDRLPPRSTNEIIGFTGKAIVYATQHGFVPAGFGNLAQQRNALSQWPTLADVPAVGTELQAGHPIATVLAAGGSPAAVLRRLEELARQVRQAVAGGVDV